MKPPLSLIHESFIGSANRPMDLGQKPVQARQPVPVIVPVDKWEEKGDPKHLTKTLRFRRPADRIRFVTELLEYEDQVGHHAKLLVDHEVVSLRLLTKGTDRITELDREYAKFVDALFKDICFSP